MKKITSLLFLTLITLFSCKKEIDKKNIFEVADAVQESLSQDDTSLLREVFIHGMDSIEDYKQKRINEAFSLIKKQIKPLNIDTNTGWLFKKIELFYKIEEDFHRVSAYYEKDTAKGTFYIEDIFVTNLNKECSDYNNQPYNPKKDLDFKSISWSTDEYGKTFENGTVELQNNTKSDITYIKFRVILKNGSNSWNAKTFLNQTVESYTKIYKGDITRIEIPGMRNYYTGFKIDEDKLIFSAESIEINPKPESYWCEKVQELNDLEQKEN